MKNFVCTIKPDELVRLYSYLDEKSWEFSPAPYAHWQAAGDQTRIVAYLSGKLTIQGKNTQDFVEFVLEPLILENTLTGESTAMIDPHGGVDESGKGDFFGPLVIAGVFVTQETGAALIREGVCDSKLIKSSKKIYELTNIIRQYTGGNIAVVALKPETYNNLYSRIGNLNRLLAWGHARVIEDLLEKVPDCPRILSDKFGSPELIKRALMSKGRTIRLDQETKAESDVAVAAASIIAREHFLRGMEKLSEEAGIELPRGASAQVKNIARQILNKHGAEIMPRFVKTHFKTYSEIIS